MSKRTKRSGARNNRHAQGGGFIAVDQPDLETILSSTENPFLLVLDGVQDPHNLGACLRTADGAGIHAVIAPRNRAVSITETVSRISCGAAENVPFVRVVNIVRTLELLREHGVNLVGTADGAGSTSLYEVDFTGPTALVLGAEGKGIRRLTQENCDQVVSIPMLGRVDCLNVSVATGVCLYEALRQRIGQSK
ncbi:MAG TPA: 23S rRNA (guanosine(2251)-2'-O)-methyltransferase RlmB [Verrucomicrobiales bacterium]|nr:23S rRNA (guanosine(2251)-2'-O)-methyltransferase RlmB [Verrucomicrobiae bacterium]RZO69195.1 MAG: 23S rRNA (guanosine(2251)-2'-O)-methyltransferase RlmB [Limisphaerales bacterium]HAO66135.1 23S rRNA (guanosine(2251)-2'-O)-methyltransferase RlmB [Verrucomicrobiales bacterium]HAQ99340.1 23S rRNA (guanosine(2251)-2'-O)-methyltransferase RlmB [Verrucomicrobiales bacterium]HAW00383.1 23S rRNA (guanosine(2251)-2'-O)-methyltransferase RlmB [Verrucomicrobiales bacterium]